MEITRIAGPFLCYAGHVLDWRVDRLVGSTARWSIAGGTIWAPGCWRIGWSVTSASRATATGSATRSGTRVGAGLGRHRPGRPQLGSLPGTPSPGHVVIDIDGGDGKTCAVGDVDPLGGRGLWVWWRSRRREPRKLGNRMGFGARVLAEKGEGGLVCPRLAHRLLSLPASGPTDRSLRCVGPLWRCSARVRRSFSCGLPG